MSSLLARKRCATFFIPQPIQFVRILLHHTHALRHALRLAVNLAHAAGAVREQHLYRVGGPQDGLAENQFYHLPKYTPPPPAAPAARGART